MTFFVTIHPIVSGRDSKMFKGMYLIVILQFIIIHLIQS